MTPFRRFLKDRSAALAATLLLAQLLLLQATGALFASAMVDAAQASGTRVICRGQSIQGDPAIPGNTANCCLDFHCALPCHAPAAFTALPTQAGNAGFAKPHMTLGPIAFSWVTSMAARAPPLYRASARAPPFSV